MSSENTLTFYLRSPFRERAEYGDVNFVNKVVEAFQSRGFTVVFRDNSDLEVARSASRPGYAMFHMEEPINDRGLSMRLAYYYPFWRIEKTARRWEWEVAKTTFDPSNVDSVEAERFVQQWRTRLYGTDFRLRDTRDSFAYIPIQGRLLERRSFQSMSPIEMIEATLNADANRLIKATLHPKEQYSTAELAAVEKLENTYANLSIVTGEVNSLVSSCAYVVTQNSAIALDGYFHRKPAILFGKIDFGHIAQNVSQIGVEMAFARLWDGQPNYESYLFWFLQKMSINAGRDGAQQQILETVRARGWAV